MDSRPEGSAPVPYPSTYSEEQASAVRMALDKMVQRQMDLAQLGARVLEILDPGYELRWEQDKIGAVRQAALDLGLLETPEERAHRTAPPEGSRYHWGT